MGAGGWRTPQGEVLDKTQGEGQLDDDPVIATPGTGWRTPGGQPLLTVEECKARHDDDLQQWTPLNVCVVAVFITGCLLVLHWAGALTV